MGYIGAFDQSVLSIVHRLPSGLHLFMVIVTNAGSPPVFIAVLLGVIAYAYMHKNKTMLIAATITLLTLPLASILKMVTHRLRPDTPYVQSMVLKTYSFPSGHAYISFVVGGFLIYWIWRTLHTNWKWAAISSLVTLILLVGLSRVYLGAHFPSDVLGGWLLALLVLAFIRFAVISRLLRR